MWIILVRFSQSLTQVLNVRKKCCGKFSMRQRQVPLTIWQNRISWIQFFFETLALSHLQIWIHFVIYDNRTKCIMKMVRNHFILKCNNFVSHIWRICKEHEKCQIPNCWRPSDLRKRYRYIRYDRSHQYHSSVNVDSLYFWGIHHRLRNSCHPQKIHADNRVGSMVLHYRYSLGYSVQHVCVPYFWSRCDSSGYIDRV